MSEFDQHAEKEYSAAVARHSVQGRAEGEPAQNYAGAEGFYMLVNLAHTGDSIPPWSYFPRKRDRKLREFYRSEQHVAGAVYSMHSRMRALDFQVEGGRNQKMRAQDLFNDANYGDGLRALVGDWAVDWNTQDNGIFAELIGRGKPDRPLMGRVEGIASLDPDQCLRTFDPEYPVLYTDPVTGTMHKLHYTRVIYSASMRQTNELARGVGFCAVSRVLGYARYFRDVMQYKREKLHGNVRGIGYGSGFTKQAMNDASAEQSIRDKNAGLAVFQNIPFLLSPGTGATSTNTTLGLLELSKLADNFDFGEEYMMYVTSLALGFGVDPRELGLAQTQSGTTKADATIQAMKTRGRGLGDMIATFESLLNQCLPEGVIVRFDYVDDDQDEQRVRIWQSLTTLYDTAAKGGFIDGEEGRAHLIAEGVLKPHLLKASPDVDDAAPASDTTDDVGGMDESNLGEDDGERDDQPPTPPAGRRAGHVHRILTPFQPATKAIQATRLDFEYDFEQLIEAGRSKSIRRATFKREGGVLIESYMRQAFVDGLVDGGVEDAVDGLADEDLTVVEALIAPQSGYVNDLAGAIYDVGLSDAEAANKLIQWWNMSIMPAYNAGRLQADANGLYEWVIGKTEKHCKDCLRLNGQKHRMKHWMKKNLTPPTSKTACGGFHCDCKLFRTTGKAKGRF